VDSSPEAKAANAAYFAEQGITHEVADDAAIGEATPPVEATKPTEPIAPGTEGSEAEETVVDAETAADWESAQTDVKRKGKYARERQKNREIKAAKEQAESKAQQLERELAELKAKLEGGEHKPEDGKPGSTAPAPVAGQPAAAPDANAAPKFEEPEPIKPKYEDFANEDDQLLAFQEARDQYNRDVASWDRRRERFEEKAAADQARQVEQAKNSHEERMAKLNIAVAEIRTKHADFDAVVQDGRVFSQALSGVSTVVPGGLEAAYQLAKDPVKLKEFNNLTAETQILNGKPVPTQRAWDLALYLLGQVGVPLTPPSSSAPAGSPPAASPSSSQPREERPAPAPARGRSAETQRREDLLGDARRDQLAAELAR